MKGAFDMLETRRSAIHPHAMPVLLQTTLLLIGSNVFMTFAWAALCICAAVWFVFRNA